MSPPSRWPTWWPLSARYSTPAASATARFLSTMWKTWSRSAPERRASRPFRTPSSPDWPCSPPYPGRNRRIFHTMLTILPQGPQGAAICQKSPLTPKKSRDRIQGTAKGHDREEYPAALNAERSRRVQGFRRAAEKAPGSRREEMPRRSPAVTGSRARSGFAPNSGGTTDL